MEKSHIAWFNVRNRLYVLYYRHSHGATKDQKWRPNSKDHIPLEVIQFSFAFTLGRIKFIYFIFFGLVLLF